MRRWLMVCLGLTVVVLTAASAHAAPSVVVLVCDMRNNLYPGDPHTTMILRVDSGRHAVSVGSRAYQAATFGDVAITWSRGMFVYSLSRPTLEVTVNTTGPLTPYSATGTCRKSATNQI